MFSSPAELRHALRWVSLVSSQVSNIDLAASTGGNCELTKDDEIVVSGGVSIIGNSNFASTTPSDASKMLGNNYINFLNLMIGEDGKVNLDVQDDIVQNTCITSDGAIVNERLK